MISSSSNINRDIIQQVETCSVEAGYSQPLCTPKLLDCMLVARYPVRIRTSIINRLFLCNVFPTLLASPTIAVLVPTHFLDLHGRARERYGTSTAMKLVHPIALSVVEARFRR
jgi:hypothetical protein